MDRQQLPDLIISGVSGGPGGTYNNVKIDGVGKVTGSVQAKTFKGNGHVHLKNDLTAEEAECNGMMEVLGHVRLGTLKVDGMLTVGESLRGEDCTLNGMIRIKGDCELEDFVGVGGFSIISSEGTLLLLGKVEKISD